MTKAKQKHLKLKRRIVKNTKVNTINKKNLPDSKLRVGGNSKSFRISLRKYKSIRKIPCEQLDTGEGVWIGEKTPCRLAEKNGYTADVALAI